MYDHGKQGVMLKPDGSMIGSIVYMVFEYIRGENLFDFIATLSDMQGLGEAVGKFFMHQLVETLEYMHNQGIVHRDIKAENIIVD